MKKNNFIITALSSLILLYGCSQISETGRFLWGTSIEHLERARVDAITKVYNCDIDDCFDAVLSLGRNEPDYEPKSKVKFYDIFLKDRIKSHIVVMGIFGNVDTTEVGIFFSRPSKTVTSIEISSLSSSAKGKVADTILKELDLRFSEVK